MQFKVLTMVSLFSLSVQSLNCYINDAFNGTIASLNIQPLKNYTSCTSLSYCSTSKHGTQSICSVSNNRYTDYSGSMDGITCAESEKERLALDLKTGNSTMCCEKEYCNAGKREMIPAVYIYKTGDYGLTYEALHHGLQFYRAKDDAVSYIGDLKSHAKFTRGAAVIGVFVIVIAAVVF